MHKGIHMVWALEYVLNEERREANRRRNELIGEVVTRHFGLDPINDADLIARGVVVLQGLRTFSERDYPDTLNRLCVAFQSLGQLRAENEGAAMAKLHQVAADIKSTSKETFGRRTEISIKTAVLRRAEPGFAQEAIEHFLPEDLELLERSAARVREFDIQGPADFRRWLDMVLANFIEFENAEDRGSRKPMFPGMGTSVRTYNRNWESILTDPTIFEKCIEAIESGKAREYGREQLASNERRRMRRNGRGNSSWAFKVHSQTQRTDEPGLDQRSAGPGLRTLTIKVETTSLPSVLAATKQWIDLPAESLVVGQWISAMVEIWGQAAVDAGIRVSCSVKSESGKSEVEFIAQSPADARTKVMQFVTASIS